MQITIAGAVQTEYNGTFTIEAVPTDDTFTYQVSGSPVTPATGTITTTADMASIEVQSTDTGADKNLDPGAQLTLKAPIAGVDDDAYVQFGKISGGTDEEDIESYRARVLDIYANPISNFNGRRYRSSIKVHSRNY